MFYAKTKHIKIGLHFIREKVLNKELHVRYVPIEQQAVDTTTKALCTNRFENLRSKLNLISSPLRLREDVKDCHLSDQLK